MLDRVRFIAIEGPIGVGKTTLARAIAARLDARLALEQPQDNPFLAKFYGNMPQYALATQLSFLIARHKQQAEILQGDLFARRVVSDYVLAKDRIFASMNLADDELRLSDYIYDAIATSAARPDVVVLLRADVPTLLSRIRARALPYEQAMPPAYIERLVAAYDESFRLWRDCPLVVIDTSDIDYPIHNIDPDDAIRRIDAAFGRS